MKYIVMQVLLGESVPELLVDVQATSRSEVTAEQVEEPQAAEGQEEVAPPMRQEVPILFPNHLNHIDVFTALKTIPSLSNATAVSAGFVNSGDMSFITCHGDSETLNLKSRGNEDSLLIRSYDYFHGLVG